MIMYIGSTEPYIEPPKIVPTAFFVRHESGSSIRTSRKSSEMYFTRPPVPR
jgi:hypothetical protein